MDRMAGMDVYMCMCLLRRGRYEGLAAGWRSACLYLDCDQAIGGGRGAWGITDG